MEPTAPESPDRRRMPREATRRPGVLRALLTIASDTEAAVEGPPIPGTVVDISPDGLCIQLPHALPPGTPVHISIAPREDAARQDHFLLRGSVTRADSIQDGFALGIRFHLHDTPPPAHALRDTTDARATVEILSAQLRGWSAEDPAPLGYLAFQQGGGGEPPPDGRPNPRARRWVLFALLLLLLLAVLIVALLWLRPAKQRVQPPPNPPFGGFDAAAFRDSPPSIPESPDEAAARFELAWGLLSANAPDAALRALAQARPVLAGPHRHRLLALARAEALAMDGGDPAPVIEAARALAEAPDTPPPWRGLANEIIDSGGEAPALSDFRALATLQSPTIDAPQTDAPQSTRVHPVHPVHPTTAPALHIDAEAYTLTVFQEGVPTHAFPIGLGKDNSTPRGTFTIANKISNPDWYHRGQSIPHGDPRNPLGDFWMGLGSQGRATSYGIHPTDDPDAIGANQSQGCIRLRPEDAEILFQLIPLGASVTIQ